MESDIKDITGVLMITMLREDGKDNMLFAKTHTEASIISLLGAIEVLKSSLLGDLGLSSVPTD